MSLAPRGARTEHDQRDQGGTEGLHTWISASGKEREWIGQAPMGEGASLLVREKRLPLEAHKTRNLHSCPCTGKPPSAHNCPVGPLAARLTEPILRGSI
jgi:hypothetical protein